jgi:hypothetical protein
MIKHRPSPSKIERSEEQFEELLATMGVDSLNPFSLAVLREGLKDIEREYERRVAQLNKQPNRKLVRQYRAAVTKHLSLSKKVGPDFLAEIEEAGWSRQNPGVDVGILHEAFTEHIAELGHKRLDLIALLTEHELDVYRWLKTTGEAYKKRYVTKLLVEPFLQLMAKHEITTSRKQRPRKRMFDALFEWVGIEKKLRPTSAGINAIARNLEGRAGTSKSNAKRRTKN